MMFIENIWRASVSFKLGFRRMASDRSGTTAIEYAVIASVLAVAVAASMGTLGPPVAALFNKLIGIIT